MSFSCKIVVIDLDFGALDGNQTLYAYRFRFSVNLSSVLELLVTKYTECVILQCKRRPMKVHVHVFFILDLNKAQGIDYETDFIVFDSVEPTKIKPMDLFNFKFTVSSVDCLQD